MRVLVPGSATGDVVVLEEGLSFWGGYDSESGTIIDKAHPQFGVSLVGKIVAMPHGRGSSSSSYVLAEALRKGTGPAGIVLGEPDSIVVIGVMVASLLYDVVCPIYVGDLGEMPEGPMRLGES